MLLAGCIGRNEHTECEQDNPPAECCYEGSPYCEPNNQNNTNNLNNSNNSNNSNNVNNGGCDPACTGGQVCDEQSGSCVDCLANTDCDTGACDTTTNECVACLQDGDGCDATAPYCDLSGAEPVCVACRGNDDCQEVTESLCTGGSCGACVMDADCAHLEDTKLCESGTCVECRVATEAVDCEGKGIGGVDSACLPDNTCGDTEAGTVTNCTPCEADGECVDNYLCVPTDFQGNAHESYCLRRVNMMPCSTPYSNVLSQVESVNGILDDYCGVVPSLTTCSAVLDLDSGVTICAQDSDCGADGIGDGICREINFQMRCTYLCDGGDQCPSNNSCGQNEPRFCGGT